MKHQSTQDLCFIGKNRYGNLNFVFWKVLEKLWKFFQPKLYEPWHINTLDFQGVHLGMHTVCNYTILILIAVLG